MAYVFKVGNNSVRAALIEWLNGHVALFHLYDDLGAFRAGQLVKVNMLTLEVTMYEAALAA